MYYSKIGRIAKNLYKEIPKHYPFVKLDSFIMMPNHIHGIIIIDRLETEGGASLDNNGSYINEYFPEYCRDVACYVSTVKNHAINKLFYSQISPKRASLSAIIRSFKSAVTKYANENKIPFKWQSRYYEHIIRNENSLINIRYYIEENHAMWARDRNNFDNIEKGKPL